MGYMSERLTPSVLVGVLSELGYSTTKASISRYTQDGLVLRPQAKKGPRIENEERVYYNPICVAEIITAILLFRGDYLEFKSSQRIARMTDRDLFLGRLMYYKEHYPYRFNVDGCKTTVDKYTDNPYLKKEGIIMEYSVVTEFIEEYKKTRFRELAVEQDAPFAIAYTNFVSEVYKKTIECVLESNSYECQMRELFLINDF